MQALFIRNLPRLQDRIRNGDLDYDLITPVNTRLLVSCRRLSVMSTLPALLGVFLVVAGAVAAIVLLPALVSAALPASVLWGGLGWHVLGFGAGVAATALLSALVFRRGLLRYAGGTA